MSNPLPRAGRVGVLVILTLLMTGCASMSKWQKRNDYWADQSISATAWNHRIRFLVIHYTDEPEKRSLQLLTGPHVSVHYLVARDPREKNGEPVVRQLVPERERAWHAGASYWRGRHNLNDTSIGIEVVNEGPVETGAHQPLHWHGYPAAQIRAVIALARDIVTRYDISPTNVVGHVDIAPERKMDPGPAFPWHRLYKAGIGAWPDAGVAASYRRLFAVQPPSIKQIQSQLARYGYGVKETGHLDAQTRAVLRAFQMHFRPESVTGYPDADTNARLWALGAKYR